MSHRSLIFIVAYNAEATLASVLDRIPEDLQEEFDFEVLVIDDSSVDETFQVGADYRRSDHRPDIPLTVLKTPSNQGYGGNQKLGYRYAIENGYDSVALLHGDGQYPPELLGELLRPLRDGTADAVFGSRMLEKGGALGGGMPIYKFVGNRILTRFQNRVLGSDLSEFHSGFRAYSTRALETIPYELNTNDFHFDTEIIIQLLTAGKRIEEFPIPTHYGDEVCHVNGMSYARQVVAATLISRLQSLGILYRRRFDVDPQRERYQLKLGYPSSHTIALEAVSEEQSVLDLGCGSGAFAQVLRESKQCRVTGIDNDDVDEVAPFRTDRFFHHDLDQLPLPEAVDEERYDVVLLLDVLEHLSSPVELLEELRRRFGADHPRLILTTPNVAFVAIRLGLLLGGFNYGPRGILDVTHRRLFTLATLKRLLSEAGYRVSKTRAVPAPFPLAFGEGRFSFGLTRLNHWAAKIFPRLFAYQIYVEAEIQPPVEELLKQTIAIGERKLDEDRAIERA